jgi:hypothetical protein
MNRIIYSAGYRSKHDLLAWLVEEGVESVVDVRYRPNSLARFAAWLAATDVIQQLEWLGSRQKIMLLCACVRRDRCHRGVILDRLEARGWTVKDLEDKAGRQQALFG